jgi:UDP-N-acetyl-2-amino-2-deoxyglucuronate dehydrogenase
MKPKLKVAILGTGKASHMHAAVLMKNPHAELVAVCSRNQDKANVFAGYYNLHAYTSVAEMVAKSKVEMVIVCTPHPYHKEVTVEAMQAGANALVEKPLAISLSDCDEMIQCATTTKKKLGVIGQRRFFPAAMRIRKAIDEGKIGTPMLGTIIMLGWRDQAYYESDPWRGKWSTEGGGVLVNQAPHQLDLLSWFINSDPAELYGQWKNINHPYVEVEDTAVAIVKFKSGAIANILVSNAQKPGIYGKVHVHGSNGASVGVQTEAGAMFIAGVTGMSAPALNDIWTIPGEEHLLKKFEEEDSLFFSGLDPIEYSINHQHCDFIDAIVNDREPMINGVQGRKSVELFTAIYESSKKNAPVRWPLS